MEKFLELEGAYLIIALLTLVITLFITTRPFFQPGAIKRRFGMMSRNKLRISLPSKVNATQ